MTLAEMYVQVVSTRKVKKITKQLCGTSISSTQVSKAVAKLDKNSQGLAQSAAGDLPISLLGCSL
jgi:transposase-like protein